MCLACRLRRRVAPRRAAPTTAPTDRVDKDDDHDDEKLRHRLRQQLHHGRFNSTGCLKIVTNRVGDRKLAFVGAVKFYQQEK